jgi:hypothetical protein
MEDSESFEAHQSSILKIRIDQRDIRIPSGCRANEFVAGYFAGRYRKLLWKTSEGSLQQLTSHRGSVSND